jgi:hypothetical protein
MDELDSFSKPIHFRDGFEEINQTHGEVKSFSLRVLNGIEEKSDELEEIESLLFDFVDFVDGLDFIFIKEGNEVGKGVFVDERGAGGRFEIDDVFDELL